MTAIHAQTAFDMSSKAEKDAQRAALAADVARFEAAGGQIQRLGTSPIDRSTITRRQVVEGGAEQRRAAKKETRA